MSRKDWDNKDYRFTAGVDHATGAFVQVWKQPHDEQDGAILIVDLLGIRPTGILPPALNRFVLDLTSEFEAYKRQYGCYPNLDQERTIRIAQIVNFSQGQVSRDVYRMWGE